MYIIKNIIFVEENDARVYSNLLNIITRCFLKTNLKFI